MPITPWASTVPLVLRWGRGLEVVGICGPLEKVDTPEGLAPPISTPVALIGTLVGTPPPKFSFLARCTPPPSEFAAGREWTGGVKPGFESGSRTGRAAAEPLETVSGGTLAGLKPCGAPGDTGKTEAPGDTGKARGTVCGSPPAVGLSGIKRGVVAPVGVRTSDCTGVIETPLFNPFPEGVVLFAPPLPVPAPVPAPDPEIAVGWEGCEGFEG